MSDPLLVAVLLFGLCREGHPCVVLRCDLMRKPLMILMQFLFTDVLAETDPLLCKGEPIYKAVSSRTKCSSFQMLFETLRFEGMKVSKTFRRFF